MHGTASAELLGREKELVSLGAFLDGLEGGGASAFVVQGEAGIGKTMVWRAGLREAESRGFRVLSCRPTGSEARFSFAALSDLLQGVLAETLSRLPLAQRAALEQALLLAEVDGPPINERAVALGFLGVLRSLAEAGSVLVAADDTQWLDRPTAAVLEFAARRLGEQPIALLLARRSEGVEPAPLGLERALPEGRLHELRLGPLSLEALHELLRARLEVALARPSLRRLYEASGGNPFFALEIGRALLRSASTPSVGAALPVPETLRELVHDRLAQLPARTREALLAAASLSRPTLPLIEAALPRGADASASLAKAVEADIVELELDQVRFTHPLLASTLYSETSLARRRRLHRRLAGVLADPEEAAWHLALAAEGPDSAVAAAVDTAAAAARARGAPEAAVLLNEHARRLTPSGQRADFWRRTMEAYEYNYQAGDPQRGRQLLEEAVALAPGSRERAEALDSLGRIYLWDELPRAQRCFEEALAEVDIDARTRAASEHGVAMALSMARKDLAAAAIHARSAVASAAEIDSIVLARAVICQAQIASERGEPQATELMERALALEGPTRHWHVLRQAGVAQIQLLVRADRLQDAFVALERIYEQAVEQGDESSIPILLEELSDGNRRLGNWAEAKRLLDEAYERSLETGHLRVQAGYLLGARARLDALLGLVSSAREGAEQAVALAEQVGANGLKIRVLGTLGLLELSLGHPAAAHDFLARAVAGAQAAGIGEPTICDYVVDDVEALVALGRLEEAELLLARHEERARALERASVLAACARCRALLLAARADLPGALGALAEALAQHQRALQPFERARTLLVLGVTQRRAKKKAAARASLEQALAVFDQLGARLWVEKAQAELARIGGRAASRLELTPTEARVAELVAAGHTNREVAAALFISVRTVDWNLAKIYRKLGLHSRHELAALARRTTGS